MQVLLRGLHRRLAVAVAATAAATAFPATAQQTINLTIGASHPTVVPWVGLMQSYFQPEVNKRLAEAGNRYRIAWREGYGGVLYKPNATLSSLGQGVVDVGWVFAATEGARLPLSQVSSYAPALTGDPRQVIDIFNRLVPSTPALKAEWERNNAVFLAATAADTLDLYTTFPVNGLANLKGKKFAASGAVALMAGGAGIVPVNSALPSYYNDVKTGVVSGVITIASGAIGIKLHEVTPYITQVDLGSFLSGALAVNKDSWNRLPAEVRSVMQAVARDYSRRLGELMLDSRKAALQVMVERGKSQNPPVRISALPAAEREAWIRALPALGRDWAKGLDAKGQPGTQVLTAYMQAVRQLGVAPLREWDK